MKTLDDTEHIMPKDIARDERHFELRVSRAEFSEMMTVMSDKRRFRLPGECGLEDEVAEAALMVLSGKVNFPDWGPMERRVFKVVVVTPDSILDEIQRLKRI